MCIRDRKTTAKTEVDFIQNFKILQTAFGKKKIERYIDVDKLTKRSFQYNMEFLQFMKCYWDMHASDSMVAETVLQESSANEQPFKQPASKQPVPKPVKVLTALGGAKRAPGVPASAPASLPSSSPTHVAPQKQQDLALESTELKSSIDNLERERDFYYMKLREVEILCQQHEGEDVPFLTQVLEILYNTDDADEFVNPEEAQA